MFDFFPENEGPKSLQAKKTNRLARVKRHLRIRKKLIGTDQRPRVSVFRSNKNIYLQLIIDGEGKTLASESTLQMTEKSININRSKEIGIKFGEKISKLGFKQVIFDRGGYLYHGNVAAIADGIRESGIEV